MATHICKQKEVNLFHYYNVLSKQDRALILLSLNYVNSKLRDAQVHLGTLPFVSVATACEAIQANMFGGTKPRVLGSILFKLESWKHTKGKNLSHSFHVTLSVKKVNKRFTARVGDYKIISRYPWAKKSTKTFSIKPVNFHLLKLPHTKALYVVTAEYNMVGALEFWLLTNCS